MILHGVLIHDDGYMYILVVIDHCASRGLVVNNIEYSFYAAFHVHLRFWPEAFGEHGALVTMAADGGCNQLAPSFSGICCSSYRQPYFDLNFFSIPLSTPVLFWSGQHMNRFLLGITAYRWKSRFATEFKTSVSSVVFPAGRDFYRIPLSRVPCHSISATRTETALCFRQLPVPCRRYLIYPKFEGLCCYSGAIRCSDHSKGQTTALTRSSGPFPLIPGDLLKSSEVGTSY
jgi:hypothetical protein